MIFSVLTLVVLVNQIKSLFNGCIHGKDHTAHSYQEEDEVVEVPGNGGDEPGEIVELVVLVVRVVVDAAEVLRRAAAAALGEPA